ncbi:MAG: hypothetical protein J6V09_05325 [Clostridia bacterium]|nr:hypothetical protein [Clostridia bacterium]
MNKKILGMKLGTVLIGLICLAVAIVIWMLVKYSLNAEAPDTSAAFSSFLPLLLFRGCI